MRLIMGLGVMGLWGYGSATAMRPGMWVQCNPKLRYAYLGFFGVPPLRGFLRMKPQAMRPLRMKPH